MSYENPSLNVATPKTDGSALLGLQKTMLEATTANPKRPVIGSWLMLPGASLARMVAQMGYDFVIVDCEHGNIADSEMHTCVNVIAAQGVSPIVRIAAPELWIVKRTLDTGAHGILCPMMNTAEEAKALVSYAKFPVPRDKQGPGVISGVRGVGAMFPSAVFKQTMQEYIATANQNTFIAVQIETVQGLENCEEIAKVEGIDMLFVGPNDLCSSMGYTSSDHPNIPEVQQAIQRVLNAAKAAGKYAGMFCTSSEQVRDRFAQGCKRLTTSSSFIGALIQFITPVDFMNLGADVIALGTWNAIELGKLKDIHTSST